MNNKRISVPSIVSFALGACVFLMTITPPLWFVLSPLVFYVPAVISLMFGIVGIVIATNDSRSDMLISIVALVFPILSLFVLFYTRPLSGAPTSNESSSSYQAPVAPIDRTYDILANEVSVGFGVFTTSTDELGETSYSLPVTITNKLTVRKAYSMEIIATGSDNRRIATDYVDVDDLAPGQAKTIATFQDIYASKTSAMETATFAIAHISEL